VVVGNISVLNSTLDCGPWSARLRWDRPMASTETMVCAICELHAEAVFRVEGMDCTEEVVILERRLKPLAGLEAVSADLIGQRLHVKYDAAKLTTSAIVDAVGQTGMRMWLEHEEPASGGDALAWRWRLVVASASALAAGTILSFAGSSTSAAVVLTAAAVAGGVFPARRALAAVRSRTLDINTLMIVAVAGALLIREWTEAAAVVCLFAVAQWLEVRTMERARQAIRALIDLSPREARVRRDGVDSQVLVENIRVGDEILVRPGDKIPLDGTILGGHSDVNEAPLTGESLPADKGPGDAVFAGSINGHGALDIRVTRLVRDTRLAQIIHLVEMAQASRAPIQSFVDRFARVYTPAVLALAVLVALVPPMTGADAATWVYRALVLLVISCPCALVISTPVSIVSALSAAARNGVLVKGGVHLERLAGVHVVAFDKTGTLTRGELKVADVLALGDTPPSEVLRSAAAVEARSEHPVARAIVAYARAQGVDARPVARFIAAPGMGAEADIDGSRVSVGNERLFRERGIAVTASSELERARENGNSVVLVAVNKVVVGAIALTDRPRDTAREAIELMREQGIRWVAMLTGDHERTAARLAEELALDEYHAELLPAQKHECVRSLAKRHGAVLMVGDGINDAPAIAAAEVGIAMGAAGSDVALETADVALMSDELLRVPYAIRLARATLRNVRMNVAISLALKAAFLVMAVLGTATLWMAVLADTGASVIVVGNALRLLRAR
jgi:Zn2+/Cd2+-exporting ATPase